MTLLRAPWLRLVRAPRRLVPSAVWAVLGIVVVVSAAGRGPSALDEALFGVFGGTALPLLAFTVVGALLGGERLQRSTAGLVSLGAGPRGAAVAHVAVAVSVAAVLGGALGLAVAMLARTPASPPLAVDLVALGQAGFLGGAAYAALFCVGSTLGPKGMGRGLVLLVDWVGGDGTGALGGLWPRAHVRSLLGDVLATPFPSRASAGILILLTLIFGLLATRLGARREA